MPVNLPQYHLTRPIGKPLSPSEDLSEGKVDSNRTCQRVVPVLQRRDAVIEEASRSAPHRNVSALDQQPTKWIGALLPAPQEYGRDSQRDGDNRSPGILLVTVLVDAELGACDIAVDQASVGI